MTKTYYCSDAEDGSPHGGHAHIKPTGEGPGINAVVWCEGTEA